MDEKPTSLLLEEATAHLNTPIIFTVVTSLFAALECSEHSCFNTIFVSSKFEQDMNAFDFLKVLRNVGASTPIILLDESANSHGNNNLTHLSGLPPVGFSTISYNFNAVLNFPFTKRELCQILMQAVDTTPQETYLELIKQTESTSSDEFNTDLSSMSDFEWYNHPFMNEFYSESSNFDELL